MKKMISCILIVLLTLHFCLPVSPFSLPTHAETIGSIGNGDYYIQNLKSGLYLDVKSGNSDNGTNVQLWSANANPQQKWRIEKLTDTDDRYVIRTLIDTTKGLDVASNYQSAGSNVDIWNANYSHMPATNTSSAVLDCCEWIIELNDDGTVCFVSYASGSSKMYLDAYGGGMTNGTNVIQSPYNGNPSMRWVLELVNPITYRPKEYIQTWDLIDSGGHIDWDGSTKYQTHFNNAVATWNQYAGYTVIRPDSASVIQDLNIYDVNWTSGQLSSVYGLTYENGDIAFNQATIDSLNHENTYVKSALIEHVMLHELGHAFGLGHTCNPGDVMLTHAISSYIHPSRYDKNNLGTNLDAYN